MTEQGLPMRVPMAQLPQGTPAGPLAAPAPAEPDPDETGSMLAALYGGIRRAEAEHDAGNGRADAKPPPRKASRSRERKKSS